MVAASPRAIFFDLDDTLIFAHGRPEQAWQTVLAALAGRFPNHDVAVVCRDLMAAARWFWSDTDRHRDGRLNLPVARRTIIARAFHALGIDDDALCNELADRFEAHRKREMKLFDGVHETLAAIADLGLKLALVTNGAAEAQRYKVERFDLAQYFHHILIEGEFGAGKPERQVYEHLLAQLDVRPDVTWMVGDNLEWEVAAPQRLGICGIWCNANGAPLPDRTDIQPDHVVRNVAELLVLLERR